MFENQYTGFDALFIDYYTNTRYKIDQELEADLFAAYLLMPLPAIRKAIKVRNWRTKSLQTHQVFNLEPIRKAS